MANMLADGMQEEKDARFDTAERTNLKAAGAIEIGANGSTILATEHLSTADAGADLGGFGGK